METNMLLENRFAKIYTTSEQPTTMICILQAEYVPEQSFKELFANISVLVGKATTPITKFVFDKQSLRTFHQASMTWYHVEWKPEMAKLGLYAYRKILPKDPLFRKSVEIGRNKISQDHPEFDWAKFDIQYCETLTDALNR